MMCIRVIYTYGIQFTALTYLHQCLYNAMMIDADKNSHLIKDSNNVFSYSISGLLILHAGRVITSSSERAISGNMSAWEQLNIILKQLNFRRWDQVSWWENSFICMARAINMLQQSIVIHAVESSRFEWIFINLLNES
jgi:hypothetical protein